MKIIVVGGVAAGASAATKARRVNEKAEIIVFERGPYVSFANCGLPYYVSGDIPDKDQLLLVTPQLFKDRFNIDVKVNHEVVSIDLKAKKVTVRAETKIFEEHYDKLVLATGGIPVIPPITGVNLPGVYTVFTIRDVEDITANLAQGIESAVIVGGGFIGLETAEALLKKGLRITLVEKMPQLVPNFDPEFSVPLEKHLKELGLKISLGKSLSVIRGEEKVEAVELEDGTEIGTDMVIMSIGVRPRIELARKAGLSIGKSGGVAVDATMLTSDPDVYAAGDIAESMHLVSGKKVRIPLAASANKQGRVAGANAAGCKKLFKGVMGSAIIKVGDLTLARTGLSEKEAQGFGMSCYVSYTPSYSHATYYPGARRMILKIVAEENTGRILGAQGVGWEGVDKRIDVFATAIYAGLTVFDLEDLDLPYAPPFASAKDPVIMAGMAASNILRSEVRHITPEQLKLMMDKEDFQLIDVRKDDEYLEGAIAGAINLPLDELRQNYQKLDKNKKTIVYCGVGYRSYNACRLLSQCGFNAYNLSGGYGAYMMSMKEGPNVKIK